MDILLERILALVNTAHGERKHLADAIGTSQNIITAWAAGTSTSYKKYVPHIAELYGVTTDYLYGLTDEMGTKKEPSTISDVGLKEIDAIFSQLSPDNRTKLLELSRLYLTSQHNS